MKVREFLAYWRKLGGGRCVPAKRDFAPMQLKTLLGSTMILHDEDGAIRFRLVGDYVHTFFSKAAVGARFAESTLIREEGEAWDELFHQAMLRGTGFFVEAVLTNGRHDFGAVKGLCLPFAVDGHDKAMMVCSLEMTGINQAWAKLEEGQNRLKIQAVTIIPSPETLSFSDLGAKTRAYLKSRYRTPFGIRAIEELEKVI